LRAIAYHAVIVDGMLAKSSPARSAGDQDMPDCLQRPPMTILQPVSTTPKPMK
jgi:hypothetical protein